MLSLIEILLNTGEILSLKIRCVIQSQKMSFQHKEFHCSYEPLVNAVFTKNQKTVVVTTVFSIAKLFSTSNNVWKTPQLKTIG